ncbi:unnamed protein product [Sympodiomycopsis kandeliae]
MANLENATEVTKIDSKAQAKIASQVQDYDALVHDAAEVTAKEQNMSTWQTIKDHPAAIMWTILLSLALVQEGYDTMLLPNFFAQPTFAKKFGTCNAAGECEISSAWQSGLLNGALIGEIIGLQIVGVTSERYGYKKTLMVSIALLTAFIFIPFFATSLPVLLVGQILQGIPWGCFQTLTTTYAADIAPLQIRGILTTYNNICWVIGQILATGVLRACLDRTDHWAYKIPYALQWIWPVPIFLASVFAPESPWWLVRKGRLDDAEHSLRRLASRSANFTKEVAQAKINEMVLTNELEKQTESGSKYWSCFKGTNLRRTEIASIVYIVQAWGGGALMGYSTYFFVQGGLSTANAANMSIGLFAVGFVGTVSSWFVMQKFNRRSMFLFGQAAAFLILLGIGIAASVKETSAASWAIGGLLLLFTFIYDLTVGPVCYSLVAEMPSAQLRSKTVALARNFYNVAGVITNAFNPRLLNPTSNIYIGAKAGYVWAAPCLVLLIYCWFRLPDPTGRTFLELDALFEAKVPARKFGTTKIDLLNHSQQQTQSQSVDEKTSTDEKMSPSAAPASLPYEA